MPAISLQSVRAWLRPDAPSDEQAMWRVQADGDPQAFALLHQRWHSRLLACCTRLIGDPHLAQDLVQETFARLYAKRGGYVPSGKFSAYIYRIAVNLCYDQMRSRRIEVVPLEGESGADSNPSATSQADPVKDPSEAAMEQEAHAGVRQALMRLPEIYRAVLVLRHYENLKFSEIAAALEIPEGTVKSRMAEALDRMHALLADAGLPATGAAASAPAATPTQSFNPAWLT